MTSSRVLFSLVSWLRVFTRGRRCTVFSCLLVLGGIMGCNDLSGLAGKQELPAGTPDPNTFRTAAGALALYQSAMAAFQFSSYGTGGNTTTKHGALVDFALMSGVLTDELQVCATCGGAPDVNNDDVNEIDARQTNQSNGTLGNVYTELQSIRNGAIIGIGALAAYDPSAPPALRGHLYALIGYAELFLADFYCSSVPLSTINFDGTFTYAAGSSTTAVYLDALAKFDTAIVLSGDSARILNFARVGKGRALLALDSLPQAAQAVANVPDDFAYQVLVNWTGTASSNLLSDLAITESNAEGNNGLPYFNDPRTLAQVTNNAVPLKYGGPAGGIFPITVADGIEATLIRAEGALQAGDVTTWLATLNRLRTNGQSSVMTYPDTVVDTLGYTGCTATIICDATGLPPGATNASLTFVTSYSVEVPDPSPAIDICRLDDARQFSCAEPTVNVYVDPTHVHTKTIWNAGTGGVAGLPPLQDPGVALSTAAAKRARAMVLFNERAYWLFLSGHRQGDLRRLIRQYGIPAEQLYPIGAYPGAQFGGYGSDVNVPISMAYESPNPLFGGCLSRGA